MNLIFAALMRANQTWRGMSFTDFERKQLELLREELRNIFATSIASL